MFKRERLRFFYALDTKFLECDMVYDEFKKFCDIYGLDIYRQDKHGLIGDINEQIFDEIKQSQYFVADVTTRNPNVMLELGYAFAQEHIGKGKIIIFHREPEKEEEKLPFDIISHNTHFYNLGSTLEQANHALEKITNKLLYWFKDPSERIGFVVQENRGFEKLFHFPIDTPHYNFARPGEREETSGGQKPNRYGNIEICHENAKGNVSSMGEQNDISSYMVLLNNQQTKHLQQKDKLHLRIQARFKNVKSCMFTFVCDGGGEIEIDGKRRWFVVGHPWVREETTLTSDYTDRSSYKVIGEGKFDITIKPEYKDTRDGPDKWTPTDHYSIAQHGLQIGLVTTVKEGTVEISEIILAREKAS